MFKTNIRINTNNISEVRAAFTERSATGYIAYIENGKTLIEWYTNGKLSAKANVGQYINPLSILNANLYKGNLYVMFQNGNERSILQNNNFTSIAIA